MSELDKFSAGQDEKTIQNKQYKILSTPHGKLIAIGLDNSNIPFFMSFTKQDMWLTYDGDYDSSVNEIIRKTESNEYSDLVRKINNSPDESGYLVLLPKVAHFLHITVSELNRKPKSLLILMCKLLFQLWFCDTITISNELAKVYFLK